MVGTTAFIEALLFGSLWLLSYPAPDARVQDPKLLHLLDHDELIGVNGTQLQEVPSELRLTLKGESVSLFCYALYTGYNWSTILYFIQLS